MKALVRPGAAAVLVLAGVVFALPQTGTPGGSTAAAVNACGEEPGTISGGGPVRAPITGPFTITSEYGPRSFGGRGAEFHAGLDLATSTAVPVVSAAAGTVTFAAAAGNAGNMVVIDHGNAVTTRSLHLATIAVRQGQSLAGGQTIGVEGNTGDSTGMHLHFEVHVHGAPVNPRDWLTHAGVTLPALGAWSVAPSLISTPTARRQQSPAGCDPVAGGINTKPVPAAYAPWVIKAGALCATVPAAVIAAQIDTESGWNPRALSPAGAQGPAQFLPGTWAAYGRDDDHNGTASPFDIGDAVMAAARYDCAIAATLKGAIPGDLLELTLAGYNAGPGAVIAHRGIPPYAQTRAYVTRIRALAATKYAAGRSR